MAVLDFEYFCRKLKSKQAMKTQIKIIVILLMGIFCLMTSSGVNAQMCRSTGNVEIEISPDLERANTVTFRYVNHNNYQVTVDSQIRLVDIDGKHKEVSRVFVIPANSSKEYSFSQSKTGMNLFVPIECTAGMKVMKCD